MGVWVYVPDIWGKVIPSYCSVIANISFEGLTSGNGSVKQGSVVSPSSNLPSVYEIRSLFTSLVHEI